MCVLFQPFRIFIYSGLILPKAVLVPGTFHRLGKDPGFLMEREVTIAELNPVHIALSEVAESALDLFAEWAQEIRALLAGRSPSW